ncbi:condensin complex subunit 2-like [Augochlora pura]
MHAHKDVTNKLIDAVAYATPSLSPLRQKSIILQKTLAPFPVAQNDDEAERLARRRDFNSTSISLSTASSNNRRSSLGLSALGNIPSTQMEALVSQFIKLGTENKINAENAFSFEMIDFMTYMIKKHDANMCNLQMASVSLDVSTKIYAFRVDGVHMDMLKLISELGKQEKNNTNAKDDAEPMSTKEENENDRVQTKKKTTQKTKQQILFTVKSLRTNVETEKPTLTNIDSDLQSTNMLFQVILPNHARSRFYFHPYNDILIDTVERKQIQDNDVDYNIPTIKDISQIQLCPPMFYFDFQSFDANNAEVQPEEMNKNTFQFDLDLSLSQGNDELCAIMNCFDDIYMEEENVEKLVQVSDQVENIVDFREVLANTVQSKPSEYSFLRKNLNIHWTGPSHWKLTASKKNFNNSNIIEKCHQVPNRRKKELELNYAIETTSSMKDKYLQNKVSKIYTRTVKMEWNEEVLTLPPDQHYDIAHANNLYLQATIFKSSESTNQTKTTDVSDIVENYIYNNDNDITNYCPQTNVDEAEEPEENNVIHDDDAFADECMLFTQPLTGGNLVCMPKMTNRTTIAHCVRAKKIDMKQLKHAIWKCLSQDSNDQDVIANANQSLQNSNNMIGTKSFVKIYKTLPMLLTKTNAESLSFPISFVSLLHLANEKTLQISSSLDMTDLIVKQD